MRVIFVNRFYWPDEPATGQLLTDLAEGLAARGHDITVIASRPPRADTPAHEMRAGVSIVRLASSRTAQTSLAGKARDFGTFLVAASWRIFRIARRDTIVVAMTDPPLLAVGAWLGARWRGARLVHWIQDIYPELAIELTGHRWLRIIRPFRNRAWRQALRCVTVGSDMATTIAAAGVDRARIVVAPNWAPAGLAPAAEADVATLRGAWGLTGKFVVAYSGNLGRVHDLDPVLAVAKAMHDDRAVAFVFIGTGAQHHALENEVRRAALENVFFFPAQPRARLAVSLGVGDLHLVTLRPGCEGLVFPSKLYGVAAAGRPVLFIGPVDSEIARLVREHALGHTATGGEIDALVRSIREFAADPSRRAQGAEAARRFTATHAAATAIARWDELLRACGGGAGTS